LLGTPEALAVGHGLLTPMTTNRPSIETTGQVIATPWFYELILWLMTKGKENAFRSEIAKIAKIKSSEFVLDAGCGTGTMSILVKRLVGNDGKVSGFEPSEEMVRFAKNKVRKSGVDVDIRQGIIERIDDPANSYDVALAIVVLHHMPDDAKIKGINEIHRVLKPGGRFLVVDSDLDLLPSIEKAGFSLQSSGKMPIIDSYDFKLWKK
jgi:ubiquinone/menaquinone biosynthesis C-methylase UbiE